MIDISHTTCSTLASEAWQSQGGAAPRQREWRQGEHRLMRVCQNTSGRHLLLDSLAMFGEGNEENAVVKDFSGLWL